MQDRLFQTEVMTVVGRHHPEWPIDRDDDAMKVVIGDMQISLDNVLLMVRDMPEAEREEAIVNFFARLRPAEHRVSTADIGYLATKHRLKLQIVPREFLETAPLMLHRVFLSELSIAYSLDEEAQYELLQQPRLRSWDISQEEIEAQATANLEALAQVGELQPRRAQKGAFVTIAAEDSHSAARLLLPHFMASLRRSLNAPQIFVGIPDRDFLVAWTPDFSERWAFAEKLKRDFENQPYPLTAEIFVSSEAGLRLATAQENKDHGR